MKNKKILKFISLMLSIVIIITLVSCGKNSDDTKVSEVDDNSDKIKIVCTVFPIYDLFKEVLGEDVENVDLQLLLDSGVDLHNYQPTAEDIVNITTADMFIYVGGESDAWVQEVLSSVNNPELKVVSLFEILDGNVKEEVVVEGMEEEAEESEEVEKSSEELSSSLEDCDYDEHVWLSLRNAESIVNSFQDLMVEINPEKTELYTSNTTAYVDKLKNLDSKYQEVVDNGKFDTVIFGDRFPFRYLFDDYGLKYYAAFTGCSAETEASFETIVFLANKVDELGVNYVVTIEGSDNKIAETVVENTLGEAEGVLALNSMQGVNLGDIESGVTYLSIAESNLEILKKVLN